MCSDSARLVILDYNVEKHRFDRIHCETYGKTGVRRVVPGEYLAVDPKGRALMIGAVERQKFVYILNRDSQANITICSPLEAHKILPPKGLSFWEMDLGLNHVIKKATVPVDITAHCLIPIPGGGGIEGPSGVLVCCEFYMVYKRLEHEDVYCSFPRRLEMGQDKGILIVSWAVHKMKDFFFVLLQSEYGDLYKKMDTLNL
ncbi:putative splicing factor 3b, subunit 3 [Cardiosporidium cionae]|uniref:Splicing factor 3b, subunit 3 n=1 Tax=Cardiosporidium cionae TaxID=476202 RepID=A0ABQ7J3Y5_9APIC|nr:putative splicing factor 3b, subunit 3 [Cardiosporidium cionae]|eukprot:KAF8817749.1 putative splicing factor 3b, subunit 3 [Cardiosporidium cionae]